VGVLPHSKEYSIYVIAKFEVEKTGDGHDFKVMNSMFIRAFVRFLAFAWPLAHLIVMFREAIEKMSARFMAEAEPSLAGKDMTELLQYVSQLDDLNDQERRGLSMLLSDNNASFEREMEMHRMALGRG